MAIDSAAKRFSAINHGCVWRGANVVPDGSIDRAAAAYLYSGIGAEAPVEVPDVVGDDQATGTTALEAEGFVVAVQTAHSSVVAAGLIISQDPTAGSFAQNGSIVTIVVSLGEAPPSAKSGGSSRHRQRKQKFVIEIDGEDFFVDSPSEAQALLEEALAVAELKASQELAKALASEQKPRRVSRVIGHKLKAPQIEVLPTGSASTNQIDLMVQDYEHRIQTLYSNTVRSAEIALLLRRQEDDDEDDAISLIL